MKAWTRHVHTAVVDTRVCSPEMDRLMGPVTTTGPRV